MPSECPQCRAAVLADQRYCLDCGHRVGALRLDWRALLRDRRPQVASASVARPPAFAGVDLPTPRVAASLLLVVLGFGVVVAGAATGDVPRALAATPGGPLTVLLPRVPAPAPPAAVADPDPPPAPPADPAPDPEPAFVPVSPEPIPVAGPPAEPDEELIDQPAAEPDVPAVKHVFLISLGPGTSEAWFGETSPVPYLARELAPRGTVLAGYRATAQGELANLVTLLSGEPPTPELEANCPVYAPREGEQGCVHGPDTYTLPDQLVALGETWKAYVEGQDAPGAQPPSCRHPEEGQADPYAAPGRPGDPYVTWRNPFVYFRTILDSPDCAANDVGLTALDADLADPRATASFSWIAPAPEHASPAGADAWLRTVVPKILASKAYAEDGLLLIVPDASGVAEDPVTGALALSADHVTAGTVDTTTYDHRSTLKSLEELFSLRYLPGVESDEVESFVSRLLH